MAITACGIYIYDSKDTFARPGMAETSLVLLHPLHACSFVLFLLPSPLPSPCQPSLQPRGVHELYGSPYRSPL